MEWGRLQSTCKGWGWHNKCKHRSLMALMKYLKEQRAAAWSLLRLGSRVNTQQVMVLQPHSSFISVHSSICMQSSCSGSSSDSCCKTVVLMMKFMLAAAQNGEVTIPNYTLWTHLSCSLILNSAMWFASTPLWGETEALMPQSCFHYYQKWPFLEIYVGLCFGPVDGSQVSRNVLVNK